MAEQITNERPERARDAFMKEFYRQRSGARKKYQEGACDLMGKPSCYDSCEYSSYCSEWKHTVWTPF